MKKIIPRQSTFFGFTLSEVLITLAIIGIVAAITIPSIISGNQKTELGAQFAKTYRTIMYTMNMSIAENGSIDTWEWKKSPSQIEQVEFVKKYFLPYMNVVKFCPDSSATGCFPDVTYKNLYGTDWANLSTREHPKFVLADGTIMAFNFFNNYPESKGRAMAIQVDVNGRRKPNTIGLDTHEFSFYPQTGECLPSGIYVNGTYNEETKSFRRYTHEELDMMCGGGKGGGFNCSAKIIIDGFKINY